MLQDPCLVCIQAKVLQHIQNANISETASCSKCPRLAAGWEPAALEWSYHSGFSGNPTAPLHFLWPLKESPTWYLKDCPHQQDCPLHPYLTINQDKLGEHQGERGLSWWWWCHGYGFEISPLALSFRKCMKTDLWKEVSLVARLSFCGDLPYIMFLDP